MEITNYKFSVKILFKAPEDYKKLIVKFVTEDKKLKVYKNFFVLTLRKIKYIIYCNGHINITGVRSKEDIRSIVQSIESSFGYSPRRMKNGKRHQIDNISATEHVNPSLINLSQFAYLSKIQNIVDFLNSEKNTARDPLKIGIFYEPELFHGLRICTNIGTGIMFASGKVNYLGSSSVDKLQWVMSRIHILNKIYVKLKFELDLGVRIKRELNQANRYKIINILFTHKSTTS